MRALTLIVITTLIFLSCKKTSEHQSIKDSLAGTWELQDIISYDPSGPVSIPSGKTYLIINRNGNMQRKTNGSVVFSGSYYLREAKDVCPQNPGLIYLTSSEFPYSYSQITVTEHELRLSTPVCYQDGGVSVYKKIE